MIKTKFKMQKLSEKELMHITGGFFNLFALIRIFIP